MSPPSLAKLLPGVDYSELLKVIVGRHKLLQLSGFTKLFRL
jgi:hypothetical protein